MVQRIPEQRATTIGLGNSPDFSDEEGEQVQDDELIQGDDLSGAGAPPHSMQAPRITQQLPRLSIPPANVRQGEILVGRYRVERLVARTPHEVVLEASHLELGQRVLLRYLSPLASASPEAVARFQRGARRAREMRSEHAERVVDFGRLDSGAPYRATELPRGPSLAEILRVRSTLPIAEAVDIILTACEPVAEAHASGVVHRCLSTQNIFVERRSDGTPLVRVLDFGVADPLEPDWVNGDDFAVPGAGASAESLRYAAPEQIRNPNAVDARADVWALGAILYELIAGAPLFQAEGTLTLLAMIAADAPTPLSLLRTDVPLELEQLTLSCLEKDPAARPRSVVEVVLALSAYASADAQPAAARVARIVMRTTRPPPMPSHAPISSSAPGRTSALVRTRPPPPRTEQPVAANGNPPGYAMLLAGAVIGLGAALIATLFARSVPPAPVAQVALPVSTVPAAVSTAPAALAVAPVSIGPAPVAAPAPAPVAIHQPPPRQQQAAPAQVPAAPRPVPRDTAPRSADTPVASRAASDGRSTSKRGQEQAKEVKADAPPERKTASADDLFGGMD